MISSIAPIKPSLGSMFIVPPLCLFFCAPTPWKSTFGYSSCPLILLWSSQYTANYKIESSFFYKSKWWVYSLNCFLYLLRNIQTYSWKRDVSFFGAVTENLAFFMSVSIGEWLRKDSNTDDGRSLPPSPSLYSDIGRRLAELVILTTFTRSWPNLSRIIYLRTLMSKLFSIFHVHVCPQRYMIYDYTYTRLYNAIHVDLIDQLFTCSLCS